MILTYYCIITMIIIAYLLGSIPSAVWIGKKYYGIDIREYGSKNAGYWDAEQPCRSFCWISSRDSSRSH